MKKLEIAQFINIMLLVLILGVFWGSWFGINRSVADISAETFLEIGKTFISNLGPTMPILFPVALLSTLPVLYFLYGQKSMRAFYLTLAGFLLFITALLVTLLVNVPIDNQIKQWTVSTLPPNWEIIRDRWQFYHTVRSFASLIGFWFILAGALISSSSTRR